MVDISRFQWQKYLLPFSFGSKGGFFLFEEVGKERESEATERRREREYKNRTKQVASDSYRYMNEFKRQF
jgi:hypothetical protein